MRVEILGPGCPRCRKTEQIVRQALEELGVEAEVRHVGDPKTFARYGVMLTPALVLDGAVKVSGRVPSLAEVREWLEEARAGATDSTGA
jgi:small redox-active disulfide protein 2